MGIYVDSSWMRKVYDELQPRQSLGRDERLETFWVRGYRQHTSQLNNTITYSLSIVPTDNTLLFLKEAWSLSE